MDLNNIKRNNLDYLLTDILPTELSDRFTYFYFYEFLLSKSDEIDDMIQRLKETKAKPDGLFKGKELGIDAFEIFNYERLIHCKRDKFSSTVSSH